MSVNTSLLAPPQYVPYMDLGGGLNTKKDPHALARNELAVSQNTFYGTGNCISKRPGTAAIAGGATGGGLPIKGLGTGRFDTRSTLIAQSGASNLYWAYPTSGVWAAISGALAAGAGPIRTAQMYDPDGTAATTVFIVDGADVPRPWTGPGGALGTVTTTGMHVPYNHTNAAPITPKFVATAGFYLFYSGEPTEPCAVYISNPFHPQIFNISAISDPTILPNPYIPYLIGWNDGVRGGNITGIESIGPSMMVYKECAVYRMDQTSGFAQTYWATTLVSASVGCLSPRSIAAFDNFHCFLGIDGVYTTDGYSTTRISDNVPTFFDGSLFGWPAAIKDRTSAIGVRHGQRYLLFYDDGAGTGIAIGHPTAGIVFDFAKLDASGLPCVTTISGMFVGGAVSLRAPADDGNFAWGDATLDRVGKFGVGYSDFGAAISVYFAGKADFMDDVFGAIAPLAYKSVDNLNLLLSVPQVTQGVSLTFLATIVTDFEASTSSAGSPILIQAAAGGGIYGAAIYGSAIYASATGVAQQYVLLKIPAQITAQGRNLQFGIQEASIYPWTILGYAPYVDQQSVAA